MSTPQESWADHLGIADLPKSKIWVNPSNPKSLRLTKLGFESASRGHKFLKLRANWETETPSVWVWLSLEKTFTSPYYTSASLGTIFVYQEGTEATILSLNGGNLRQYLNSIR